MGIQEFRANRDRFAVTELAKYQGQWVAFSSDGRRIIASHLDLVALDNLIVATGEDPEKAALEWIEFGDVCLGGAELQ